MSHPTNRIVHRAEIALRCQDEGDGPPVVFLAGWSLPGASWHRQVEAFHTAGLRCITYDRRGHGLTPDPGHGYDFDTLADDLASVLDAFDLHGVTLVTFSAGRLGRGFAVHHPIGAATDHPGYAPKPFPRLRIAAR